MYIESSILHLYLVPPSPFLRYTFLRRFYLSVLSHFNPFLPLLYARTAQVITIYNTLSQEKPKVPAALWSALFQVNTRVPIN